MSSVHPTTGSNHLLLNSFRCSIVLKGLHALLESVTGIALFLVPGRAINSIILFVGRLDLSRLSSDVINMYLRHFAQGMVGTGRHFAAVYLLTHGIVKLVLVIELLRNRLWAYPLMIVMLGVFIGYQMYRFALTHSMAMILLTVFDLIVIALTWMEYREQLRIRREAHAGSL